MNDRWVAQIDRDGSIHGPALLKFKKYKFGDYYEPCYDKDNYVHGISSTGYEAELIGYVPWESEYGAERYGFIGTKEEVQAFIDGAESIKKLIKKFAEQK